ncbi:hypothetical protein F6B93_04255 [Mycobacterium spongiae]|uniref:DUF2721 domain-containing protein n=1 Tax=Mycobacterium spongiae TaxID=886343 RepID=A0A975PYR1_9MYCO|nr:hypothetical protein F6B93_04255 [Mycobacterium spongiae]
MLIGAAPVLGGLVLGVFAANFFQGADVRGSVKDDLDLLDRIPADQAQRRAELRRSIDLRIDDLIASVDRGHALRDAAITYRGNWRAGLLFVSAVVFAYIWWSVDHSRSDWLSMFLVLIVLAVLAFISTARATFAAMSAYRRSRRHPPRSTA